MGNLFLTWDIVSHFVGYAESALCGLYAYSQQGQHPVVPFGCETTDMYGLESCGRK